MATIASGLRAPFARSGLSGFLTDFGDGAPPLLGAGAMLAWQHRRVTT